MIGAALLAAVDSRLRDIKCNEIPFGGMNIIFGGDLAQLPPVQAMSLCGKVKADTNTFDRNGCHLFQDTRDMITLEVNQRIDQSESGRKLQQFSKNVREGNVDQALHNELAAHCAMTNFGAGEEWEGAIHLFAKKKECHAHNLSCLDKLITQKVLLKAKNSCERAERTSDDKASGLPNKMVLVVGSRVMLRKNLKQSVGLFNGAMGEVKWIKYSDPANPSQLPDFVAVEMDTYTGPAWIKPIGWDGDLQSEHNPYRKIVPIRPYRCQFADSESND
eukprot:Nk52_evm1s548 gene=Nk52_evmTU1s548